MEYGNQASTAAAAEEYREEDVVVEVKQKEETQILEDISNNIFLCQFFFFNASINQYKGAE